MLPTIGSVDWSSNLYLWKTTLCPSQPPLRLAATPQGGQIMPSLARRWGDVTSPGCQHLEINNNDSILSESGEAATEHEDGQKLNDDDSCLSFTPIPLPPPLMSSIKHVLHTLKVKGECPVNWRVLSSKYRTITRMTSGFSLPGN